MKAYKGFNENMTCRDFQYEEGKSYEMEDAELCDHGFHACAYPLDCLNYYAPASSVYHEVEQENVTSEKQEDTKQVSSKIKIGARLDVAGLVKASVEYVKERADKPNSATGYRSANSATGYRSANSATGDRSANSATGNRSANSATGYGSANISTGIECENSSGQKDIISVGWGKDNKCRGVAGSYLVLVERGEWDGEKYPMLGEPILVKVDGEKIKENVWYMLKNGTITEVDGND